MAPHSTTRGHRARLEDWPRASRRGMRDDLPSAVPSACGSDQPDRPAKRRADSAWNLLLVMSLFFLAVAGCKDENAFEMKRQRAAAAGERDGRAAGASDGFNSAYEPAKDDAYDAKVEELYASGNFTRPRSYTSVVLGVAFFVGFGLQYALLYLLRRKELLFDIDRIVLPKHETQVNLTSLLDT